MADDQRPDPDALLESIKRREGEKGSGKLKIFFGMCAGVGKTYAMLKAAQKKKAEGVDVVVGYVETHRRAETDALTDGLEILPRRKTGYRGVTLEEMDIDAVMARKPALVLVDELAHTNAEGSRHPKRYQDVVEILDAGIDVYTTVNVQHLESRADTVAQITGVVVRETVPDGIIDRVSEIELIDISPENLIRRLEEGKVYLGEQAARAAGNFFTPANLTTLREMALRLTAERVDHDLLEYRAGARGEPWKSGDRLMVTVGPSPFSARLVRWTRRMAYNMNAPWLAVHIDSGRELSEEELRLLSRNLTLAGELGAEVITKYDADIVQGLMRVARQRNVTQIVIGKPLKSWYVEFFSGGGLVDRLVRQSGNIDIYVVRGESGYAEKTRAHSLTSIDRLGSSRYVPAAAAIAVITLLNVWLEPHAGYRSAALLYLFGIIAMAPFFSRGPLLAAAALSALLWNFLFIPPKYTFSISTFEDLLMFMMYFVLALFAGGIAAKMRERERELRRSDERTMALYALAREIAGAATVDEIVGVSVRQMTSVFDADIALWVADPDGRLAAAAHRMSAYSPDEKESAVALWAFRNKKTAGRFTDTLPDSPGSYFPLFTAAGAVGVMGMRFRGGAGVSHEQWALIEMFAGQIAFVIEREIRRGTPAAKR